MRDSTINNVWKHNLTMPRGVEAMLPAMWVRLPHRLSIARLVSGTPERLPIPGSTFIKSPTAGAFAVARIQRPMQMITQRCTVFLQARWSLVSANQRTPTPNFETRNDCVV